MNKTADSTIEKLCAEEMCSFKASLSKSRWEFCSLVSLDIEKNRYFSHLLEYSIYQIFNANNKAGDSTFEIPSGSRNSSTENLMEEI